MEINYIRYSDVFIAGKTGCSATQKTLSELQLPKEYLQL